MDNKAIANILFETADLLEIDGQDSFRIRSYRNAAQAIENHSQQIKEIIGDPKQVLAIAGIGKGMLNNLKELFDTGKLAVQALEGLAGKDDQALTRLAGALNAKRPQRFLVLPHCAMPMPANSSVRKAGWIKLFSGARAMSSAKSSARLRRPKAYATPTGPRLVSSCMPATLLCGMIMK